MPSASKLKVEEPSDAKRAALYLRVSTSRQAEADLSIPDQRRQAIAFCAARGWQVAAEFVEPGASGMDDRRPELQRLLDLATSGGAPFDVVVVHSFMRTNVLTGETPFRRAYIRAVVDQVEGR